MDWKTAKNYIIFLLSLMNIILVLSILGHNNNASIDNPYFSVKSLNALKKVLEDRNITLSTDLSKEIHTVGVINVEYEVFNEEKNPDLFRDFEEVRTFENSKKIRIEIPHEALFLDGQAYDPQDEKEQKLFTEQFLMNYFPYRHFHLKTAENGRWIFNPLISGILFEESFVEFHFGADHVIIEAISILPKEESPNRREAMTSVEAILSALPQLSAGDRIVALDFIYYFDLSEEELYRVKNARAFPHWRMITDKNKVLYIPAFKN